MDDERLPIGSAVDVGVRVWPRPSVDHTAADSQVESDDEIASMGDTELVEGIERLRAEKQAIILAHNYQIPPIQDLADFVGDSLQLSQQAAAADARLIVFCGVHFMAETAAILCPEKKVLIPDVEAGCSLAATVTAEQVREWRRENPDGVVVSYVNTDAEVKAESDYCCTSSNAVDVVRSVPEGREILFLPDMFLGLFVERQSGRRLQLWLGECHVHAGIRPDDIGDLLDEHRDAHLLLHPECGCVSQCLYALGEGDLPADRTFVLSTGGMVRHGRECSAGHDYVGTETGLLHRLRTENPDKEFIPLREDAICEYMKKITLPKLYRSLRDEVEQVVVPEPIATRARVAIDRMMKVPAL
ncbi:MAG: Quinolinate synthase A [Acidimicrobiales bacterium]|nr:MAG: quinolinate synthase NadA [Actinomycetota bacterium]MBV6508200.1 Quinolinate synthase A [Acidimicrobiales bacterium]RIK07275.1 MAG: quinolinate synthase [Acidobacteriota bacterium]